ncbi:enoyl-CoA hydratase/isomerase family protein [Brevundimonas sp.]|uniref:enoyl-CoA hydratase/isomerase family protein n=1 Tax=Brevundimonas sp. TaxID=1871086 RepID=UPI003B003323
MGIIPGGAGTQLLAERTTRGRALEIVLGADLIDADVAERYGWINRALPAADLDAFVDRLARNVAALPDGVLAAAKAALPPSPLEDGLKREHEAWAGLFGASRSRDPDPRRPERRGSDCRRRALS